MKTRWFWLSFADGNLPKGTQFLGAVLVCAPSFFAAIQLAWELKINPGGECQGHELAADLVVPDGVANKLFKTREACDAAGEAVAAATQAGRKPHG